MNFPAANRGGGLAALWQRFGLGLAALWQREPVKGANQGMGVKASCSPLSGASLTLRGTHSCQSQTPYVRMGPVPNSLQLFRVRSASGEVYLSVLIRRIPVTICV